MYAILRYLAPRSSACRRAFPPQAWLSCLGALLLWLAVPYAAHADCTFDKINGNGNGAGNRYTSSPVNFTITGPITVPFDFVYGQLLGSPVTAQPTKPPGVTCDPYTLYGVSNVVGGWPSGYPDYIYPTGISGIGYQLIHANTPDEFMAPYPFEWTGGGSSSFSVGTTLQFVQTGPIANGATVASGTLANWRWGSIVPEYFVLSNAVTFLAPACKVVTKSISVTLPLVATGAFAGKDSTAGATPFDIQLTCPSGSTATMEIQLDAQAGTAPGYTDVLANQGTASGVGVELKDQNGASVVFGQAATVGATVSGSMTLPYTAQYHATSATIVGGTIKATATFTLTYQ